MAKRPKNDTPVMRTITASGQRSGAYRTDVGIRDFSFVIDEPEKLGGQNHAPTPMEYVVGALNGCFTVTIEMVAEEHELDLKELNVESAGEVDHRGLFGTAAVSPHFQSVQVDIAMVTGIAIDQLQAFKDEVLVRCPVYNLISDSGADINVNWAIEKTAT